jgi:hypothetical protein
MPLTNDLKASYEAVMNDLEAERELVQQQIAPLQSRLKELHYSISTLSKRLSPDLPFSRPSSPTRSQSQKYAHMSVRWAILDFLNDSEPTATAEIAEALKDKGVQTKAANFVNNVSAVLSSMMKPPQIEVNQLPDGRWQLNENGRNAIAHIRSLAKFRRSFAS